MITQFLLRNLPNSDQRLEAMLQAFDDFMLVLDKKGRILDYKSGDGPSLNILQKNPNPLYLEDVVPLDVKKKYDQALAELKNGNKVVFFEYMLSRVSGDTWYESRLVPFTNHQNIMFVRNITKYRQSSGVDLTLAYEKTIEGWSQALYLRDHETEDHTRRVTEMTLNLARRLHIPPMEMIHIRRGATLHDIGKVAIPDHILFKPGPLTEEEWITMRRHPLIAVEILKSISYLAPALTIPRSHHEKWDGSGYPDGLAGEDIPLPARIFAFADVFDALTSNRPYREAAWSQADALDYVRKNSGTHFDPNIVPHFIEMLQN
jgi:HD-GYP domain-containing protein (c-di-GMP phosphodiesterase class II)